ncbi:hypothetical protein LTR94_031283, partial [Friedmanniomyces endolithicus]
LVARHAVDPAGRQMEQQVDDPRNAQPVQRLGQRRADALERLYLGEQRIEDIGSHDYVRPTIPPLPVMPAKAGIFA